MDLSLKRYLELIGRFPKVQGTMGKDLAKACQLTKQHIRDAMVDDRTFLIELKSSLIELRSSSIQIESSLIQLDSFLIELKSSISLI